MLIRTAVLRKPAYQVLCFIGIILCNCCMAQCTSSPCILDTLKALENNRGILPQAKIPEIKNLIRQYKKVPDANDSVYARLLHRLGVYQYLANNQVASNEVIGNMLAAAGSNMQNSKTASKSFAINSFYNLGFLYNSLSLTDVARRYFDTVVQLAQQYPDPGNFEYSARIHLVDYMFKKGDYQMAQEESTQGLLKARREGVDSFVIKFSNLRAQSLYFQSHLPEAAADADTAAAIAKRINKINDYIVALKIRAQVYAARGNTAFAEQLFETAIKNRLQQNDYAIAASDYLDYGNYYTETKHDNNKAGQCYVNSLYYAKKAGVQTTVALAETNLDLFYFFKQQYAEALRHNLQAQKILMDDSTADYGHLPPLVTVNAIDDKQALYFIFANRTETLTYLFKQTKNTAYLDAALSTAKFTDSLLTLMRITQTGEQSKLYWRSLAKMFYGYALEASYVAGNKTLAFYFMEKSRSVLLGDALNELGAAARLPAAEFLQQQQLQVNVIEQQQKLNQLSNSSPVYTALQAKLLQTKDDLQHYLEMLELKFPSYYHYKYADVVPSLTDMQKFLQKNGQAFVHYFTTDTTVYILATTPGNATFLKLSTIDFEKEYIQPFQQFCSSEEMLNSNYASFARLSNRLYNQLFKPLQLPPGKVIICTDDFLVPFDALCSDSTGKNFLISSYTFSYVYSASYLLRKFDANQPDGNFFGVAPVGFTSFAGLPDLAGSDNALDQSRQYYSDSKVFTGQNATRKNFFRYAPGYSVVTFFSHASADTASNEPVMYLSDSVIRLSDLLLFSNPATQLVILSACETNVGKKAAGEGVYSLARGFSAAGIPAVAATLWNANDQATYAITQEFNRNLAAGMQKDEALKQAKLTYMRAGGSTLLPYYWANMVVAGNTEPLQLSANHVFVWVTAVCMCLAILAVAIIWVARRKKTQQKTTPL